MLLRTSAPALLSLALSLLGPALGSAVLGPILASCGSHPETRVASPTETPRPTEIALQVENLTFRYSPEQLGLMEVDGQFQVNPSALRAELVALSERVERPMVAGSIDRENRVVVQDVPGRSLLLPEAMHAVSEQLVLGAPEIRLPTFETLSETPIPDGLSFDRVVAEWETRYRQYQRSRSRNVELATELLDGTIIAPGEVISFNGEVGERSRANGFRMAKVISGGELVNGMGGGVCQVASTLHAAAFSAGLEMVEYRPHSRPSSYIPLGLDATVSWPDIDLQIRNPFDTPIFVSAVAERGRLKVELFAAAAPAEVEIRRRVVGRNNFEDRVVIDPSLAEGEEVVSQEGIRGARVLRERTIRRGDVEETESDRVRYPPTDRIIRVSPTDPRAALAAG